jgi:CBS domain-containing protein
MLVKYAMNARPVSVEPTASREVAARRMANAGIGALPVVVDDEVIGVVTDRDLALKAMARGLSPENLVETVMSADPARVDADAAVTVAIQAMRSLGVRDLPVVSDGRIVGMVSRDELYWYLAQQMAELADTSAVPPAT